MSISRFRVTDESHELRNVGTAGGVMTWQVRMGRLLSGLRLTNDSGSIRMLLPLGSRLCARSLGRFKRMRLVEV